MSLSTTIQSGNIRNNPCIMTSQVLHDISIVFWQKLKFYIIMLWIHVGDEGVFTQVKFTIYVLVCPWKSVEKSGKSQWKVREFCLSWLLATLICHVMWILCMTWLLPISCSNMYWTTTCHEYHVSNFPPWYLCVTQKQ